VNILNFSKNWKFFLQKWAFFLTVKVFTFYARPLDADPIAFIDVSPLILDAGASKENIII